MIKIIKDRIDNVNGDSIGYSLYKNNTTSHNELVIICHGFKGFRNWGFIPYLAEELSKSEFDVATIDFSLNGYDEETKTFDEDQFSRNTVGSQISDLKELINHLNTQNDYNNINLLGHSLGGAVSLITANELGEIINKVALWGSICKLDRNTERQKSEWKKQGYIEISVPFTNQILKLNSTYLTDKEENSDRYNLEEIMATLGSRVAIIHGKQDVTVNFREAENLFKWSGEKARLEYIEKCSHIFNSKHPFEESNPALDKSIEITSNFFLDRQ